MLGGIDDGERKPADKLAIAIAGFIVGAALMVVIDGCNHDFERDKKAGNVGRAGVHGRTRGVDGAAPECV